MKKNRTTFLQFFLTLLILVGLSGCQSENSPSGSLSEIQNNPSGETGSAQKPATQNEKPDKNSPKVTKNEANGSDTDEIKLQWENSPHANTYVVDSAGKNNSCSKCHSPIDWMPTMDELPESCFACKFELSEPPSLIEETSWQSVPCKICHQVDKKGKVASEISWLEIPQLGEYAKVQNANEICLKCHIPTNVEDHIGIEIGGAHADFLCTDCHNSHTLTTSCGESTCHESLLEPGKIIPGHDDNHLNVACEACHDAAGLEVGLVEETGIWTTFAPWIIELNGAQSSGLSRFVSHNTALEVNCERCHFANNPWNLTVDIEK